ncbi:MAG: protein-export chaperone SecB [Gammaproteobacteria bacterium]|nr:protein-export chaperone SecB [Gammaproteobacteria bacterium]NNF60143.1 protein-export chaperone SecB [Gammaproteobacteria bacterium]NNM21555.1 protein-export chaperone SecB [Gammaproteobacteria bacterium]
MTQEAPARQILVQKLYIKDLSFEAPTTPAIYSKEWRPEVNLNLQTKNQSVGDSLREVVLSITAEAKVEGEVAFIVEVHQAGVFQISGFSDEELGPLIGAYCPTQLFPFAREAITDLVGKGGFPGLLLQPVNFDALYMQQREEVARAAAESGDTEKH